MGTIAHDLASPLDEAIRATTDIALYDEFTNGSLAEVVSGLRRAWAWGAGGGGWGSCDGAGKAHEGAGTVEPEETRGATIIVIIVTITLTLVGVCVHRRRGRGRRVGDAACDEGDAFLARSAAEAGRSSGARTRGCSGEVGGDQGRVRAAVDGRLGGL